MDGSTSGDSPVDSNHDLAENPSEIGLRRRKMIANVAKDTIDSGKYHYLCIFQLTCEIIILLNVFIELYLLPFLT